MAFDDQYGILEKLEEKKTNKTMLRQKIQERKPKKGRLEVSKHYFMSELGQRCGCYGEPKTKKI